MSHKIARAFSTQEEVIAVRRAQSARACTRLEHNANATGRTCIRGVDLRTYIKGVDLRTCIKGVDLPASELFNGLFTQTSRGGLKMEAALDRNRNGSYWTQSSRSSSSSSSVRARYGKQRRSERRPRGRGYVGCQRAEESMKRVEYRYFSM